MAWEHLIARQLKAGQAPSSPAWFAGDVVSPTRHVDPTTGKVTLSGPLIVSCYKGEVMLQGSRLRKLGYIGGEDLYEGLTVALLGDVFSGWAGSQTVLILGVI